MMDILIVRNVIEMEYAQNAKIINIRAIIVKYLVKIALVDYALQMVHVQTLQVIVIIIYFMDQNVINPVMKQMSFVKHVIEMENVFLAKVN
jgi:hypothetical protein